MAKQYRVNETIRAQEVRVIGETGEQLGLMPTRKALEMAREHELDLVEVAPNSTPPVCRMIDYGKLRYLYAKKERESKKNQKSTGLREVRFRPNIGVHDFDAKTRKVRELIEDGAKVKITVRFRGREAAHQQLGLSLLKRVATELKDEVRLENPPAAEPRALTMILIPAARRPEKAERGDKEDKKVEGLADAKT